MTDDIYPVPAPKHKVIGSIPATIRSDGEAEVPVNVEAERQRKIKRRIASLLAEERELWAFVRKHDEVGDLARDWGETVQVLRKVLGALREHESPDIGSLAATCYQDFGDEIALLEEHLARYERRVPR